jgi:leucyl-tRNA synthetase
LSNALGDFKVEPATASASDVFAVREALESLVLMLTPFSPHVAEEMWEGLGRAGGILNSDARWPVANAELARKDELEIPVQINGKLRSRIIATPDTSQDELRAAALADEKIHGFMEGREVVKVIVVPQRLVNIVVR